MIPAITGSKKFKAHKGINFQIPPKKRQMRKALYVPSSSAITEALAKREEGSKGGMDVFVSRDIAGHLNYFIASSF